MPLIRNGVVVEDNTPVHPLADFVMEAAELVATNAALGVRLSPEDDPHALQDHLGRITLIEIHFPRYTDGRGFSQAQLLRRRLGYSGELRAVGHVLRDQLLYMHRSGFDAYSTNRADLTSFLEAMGEFSSFYQPAADGTRGVFAARHGR